ncbi:MAG: methyltransferase domain-containing protein [Candidatus Woesearchaeota archaeon]|nr:methyltransferase domain-containing protein [Candidatus Woesearchaeota archaeon]
METAIERNNHTPFGLLVYVTGMEKSIPEKEKLMPYVKGERVLEIGCGSGAVLELLSRNFPKSAIIGIDNSEQMLSVAKGREYSTSNVTILYGDALNKRFEDESIDTIILSSVLHEVYSYNNYHMEALEKAVSNACEMLVPGGRIIIRDGVMPTPQVYYLKFRNNETKDSFKKFADDFTPRKISYSLASDSGFPKLGSADAYEFLSKYFYKENWAIEVKEQFGILNLSEYCDILERNGMQIVDAQSYLIDFLKCKYEKDVSLLEKKDGIYVPANYPDSTAIIIAEKR